MDLIASLRERGIGGRGQFVELTTRLLWGVLGGYTILAAVFHWLPSNTAMIPGLAALAALASAGLIWFVRDTIGETFARLSDILTAIPIRRWVIGCLALGLALRVLCALAFPTSLVSDPENYWILARRLAAGEPFGLAPWQSYWPPGLAFALTPFFIVFGAARWVTVLVNLLLFAGTAWAALHLAERTADRCAGRVAVLILAIWPNLVLLAGAPHKELLVAFLLPMSALLYLRAAEAPEQGRASRWSNLAGSGLCLGFAALTQPAAALFGLVFAGYEALASAPPRRKAARLALAGLVAISTVLPWTVRNYAVLGAFVPINTAGGMVFYSANNPHATGGWIESGAYADAELQQADEIGQNRLAYRKALAWISENRRQFMKLIVIKQARFLCCDDYGASMLFTHPELTHDADPALGRVSAVASNAFWIGLALVVLCGAVIANRVVGLRQPAALLSLLAIWYFLAIFSVFQSEGKHHVNVAAFIAVVASCAFRRPDVARRGSGVA